MTSAFANGARWVGFGVEILILRAQNITYSRLAQLMVVFSIEPCYTGFLLDDGVDYEPNLSVPSAGRQRLASLRIVAS